MRFPSVSYSVYVCALPTRVPQAQVVAVSFMSPNQEVAFVLAAGYSAVAIITAGVFVTIPQMWAPVSWLQYISILKYPYQGRVVV